MWWWCRADKGHAGMWAARHVGVSAASGLHLSCASAASGLHLGCIWAAPELHLGCIWPAPELHIGPISAASRLHLGYIWPSRPCIGCCSAVLRAPVPPFADEVTPCPAAGRRYQRPSSNHLAPDPRYTLHIGYSLQRFLCSSLGERFVHYPGGDYL